MYEIQNAKKHNEKLFEDIKHMDEWGKEYWEARELYKVLEYQSWNKFLNVICKATTACENSGYMFKEHFSQVGKMINLGKNAVREVKDYKLTRYACYLIVQNADPNKEVVALGQTYFAIQTRKQEISEKEYKKLSEIDKRFYNRNITLINEITNKELHYNMSDLYNCRIGTIRYN